MIAGCCQYGQVRYRHGSGGAVGASAAGMQGAVGGTFSRDRWGGGVLLLVVRSQVEQQERRGRAQGAGVGGVGLPAGEERKEGQPARVGGAGEGGGVCQLANLSAFRLVGKLESWRGAGGAGWVIAECSDCIVHSLHSAITSTSERAGCGWFLGLPGG